MTCPNCASELTKGKKGWFCEDCGYKQPLSQTLRLEADDLFYAGAFDTYYPLLAHEYHVLYRFIKEQNYFGALLEYKDVVEIVLKFPVLIAINHLWRKDNYELPEEKSILELLLGKPLSLGDWKAICELFIKLYGRKDAEKNNIAESLKPILEEVRKFYDKERIVNWRNETIGHGALQTNLESDAEFMGEFSERLNALKGHLEDNRLLYECIVVLDKSENALKGKDCEEQLSDELKIRLGNAQYDQEPFILVKEKTTNIFDSCVKDSVYVLNYITGSKEPHALADVFLEKRKVFLGNERIAELEKSGSRLADTAFNSGEIEILNRMADEKEVFTNPEYITDDIKSFLTKSERGVLFVQMERGMGKTTLVRAMDQLAMGNVRLDEGRNDIAVRAYYINNMFSYRLDHFQNETGFILANAVNFGIERLTLSAISTNFTGAEDMAAEFARFLNDMLGVYRQKTRAKRLIYVIDGLDEIRHEGKENRTIFDCVPSSETLDEGVYVIVTGRHKQETAKWIQEKYTVIENKTETIKYSRKDEHNTRILASYLAKQLYAKETAKLEGEEAEVVKKVIEKGDNRFLYVKALRELLKADTFDINEISGGDIIDRYLKVLEHKYGKGKHYDRMKRLLLIAALLDEPAAIEELSYLYSLEPADLKFMGCLTDLKGLLYIDRTGAGETVSANVGSMHDDWKRYLIDRNKEMTLNIITGWINVIREKIRSYKNGDTAVLENITSGESYLTSNIYLLVESYQPESKNFFSDEDVRDFLSSFAKKITEDNSIINAVRAEKIYTGLIFDIEAQTGPYDEVKLANYFTGRGDLRYKLRSLRDAITDFEKCIEIRERLQREDKMFNEKDLARAYINKGVAYNLITEYNKAIIEFNKGIEIMERLQREGKMIDENDMASVYHYKGVAYDSMTEYNKALIEYDKCIEIEERLYREGKLLDENSLASTYLNRGVSYYSMTKYDKAIIEYEKCIEIMERLKHEGKIFEENNLALAYMNRGIIYALMKEYDKAIVEFDKCIEIKERLQHEGKIFDENDLALSYMNRGDAYALMKEYDKAINEFDKCIEIREQLQREGKMFDRNYFAVAYLDRGETYYLMNEYDKAVTEYDKCMEIMEQLQHDGKLFDENYLANAYIDRGKVYNSKKEHGKAVIEYDKSIEIFERLKKEGKFYNEDNLTEAYANKKAAQDAINAK
jgi:tetratricopeptide (TPR) repeat protein